MAVYIACAFFIAAIAGRMLIQWRRTGDHGLRVVRADAPLAEILPAAGFVGSFGLSYLLLIHDALAAHPIAGPQVEPASAVGVVATAVGIAGICITLVAQLQMGRSWRIGVDTSEQTRLVTHGLYAKSRNPIYFGIFLYWLSMIGNVPHPVMWGCALMSWISIEFIVRTQEEPYLRALHGSTFDDYCRRTHRYWIV